jgi:Lhr-like helicase
MGTKSGERESRGVEVEAVAEDRARIPSWFGEAVPWIQVALRITIDKMSDTQIIHQLLSQLGIKVEQHWSRSVLTHEGEKLRVYQLDQAHWQSAWAVLERRAAKRSELHRQQQMQADQLIGMLKAGSPPHFGDKKQGGDPEPDLDAKQAELLSDECLADLRKMIVTAGDAAALLAVIREMVPQAVLERVGLSDR